MKTTLLLAITLIISLSVKAQDLDSLKIEILLIKEEQQEMKMNLRAHQGQFKFGVGLSVIGAAILIVNNIQEPSGEADKSKNKTMNILGGSVLVIGSYIQIDSHKWIGRAGRRRRS